MIGFKYLGESISKWEKSFFGGYHRLIIDYPRVEIDNKIDFKFAPISDLTYFEKEKVLKIFLSKTKSRKLIDVLMKKSNTITETDFLGKKTIKTIVNVDSKRDVLDSLNRKEKEYAPLFRHYKHFILDSEIYFESYDSSDGGEGEKNEDDEQKENESKQNQSQGQGGQGDQDENQDREENKDVQGSTDGDDKNSSDKKTGESSDGTNKTSPSAKSKNLREFKKSLNKIREDKKIKFKSLSRFDRKTNVKIERPNNSETKFIHQEILMAERLSKMLDISFDPTHDVVKNLRLGKLDITKIAEVPAGNIAIYKQNIEDQATKPFSVAILCDESGSMDYSKRIYPQYHTVKALYKCFSEILPQDKIFIYGHSGDFSPELYVYHDSYNQNFLNTIDKMLTRNYAQNYDGPVIEEVYKNIRAATSDRIIFIVLSDGKPSGDDYGSWDDYTDMQKIIEKCKRDDFVTIGIGIQHLNVRGLYQYSTVVNDLSDMPKKVSHIVNHVVKTEFQ